ncbi:MULTISPECIES: terpene synthase family protein [unclassified Streptomyces]|uniref:terpene synthase family protein n=1 Tax=unclassified Streptomyces TaxID=2593676 RepID=UPI0033F4CFDF
MAPRKPPSAFDLSHLRGFPPRDGNPDATRAEAVIRRECLAVGLTQPSHAAYTSMTRYLFPVTPADRLIPMGLLNDILFYVDDLHSPHRSSLDDTMSPQVADMMNRAVAALRTGAVSAGALPDSKAISTGFARVRELFLRSAAPLLLERLGTAVEQCLHAMKRPVRDIFVNGTPDIERYTRIRYSDSGMKVEVELADYARGFLLPDEVIRHPVIERARDITVHIGGLMNDLFSYHKEVVRHGQMFNLVPVMQAALHCSPQEAFNAAVDHVNQLTDEFEEILLSQQTLAATPMADQTTRYLESLADQIAATYHWQFHTSRYKEAGSVVPLLKAPAEP